MRCKTLRVIKVLDVQSSSQSKVIILQFNIGLRSPPLCYNHINAGEMSNDDAREFVHQMEENGRLNSVLWGAWLNHSHDLLQAKACIQVRSSVVLAKS